MIKANVNEGSVSLTVSGTIDTLAAELCVLCEAVVEGIKEKNEKCAKKFVEILTDDGEDSMIKMALDSGLNDDVLRRHQEKFADEMSKQLDDLKKRLQEITDAMQ